MNPWIAWGIVFALVIGREIYRWRRDVKLRHVLELLNWRERFARTRTDLVDLIHRGELKPHSLVGSIMYIMSSAMVRRASTFRQFAGSAVSEAIRETHKAEQVADQLEQEIRSLSPDACEVFVRFVDDTHRLLLRYSRLYRLIHWLSIVFAWTSPKTTSVDRRRHIPWRRLDDRLAVYERTTRYRHLATA